MTRVQISTEDNKYFTSHYNHHLQLFEQVWHEESKNMEDDHYKSFIQHNIYTLDSIEDCNVERYYLDNRENFFTLSPELQSWHANNIAFKIPEYSKDPQNIKIALVVSSDFISQLSIEQTMEEDQTMEDTTKYFDSKEEAMEWLLAGLEKSESVDAL